MGGNSRECDKNFKSKWCYVDHMKCSRSNETYTQDLDFPGFYYSYSTCSPQYITANYDQRRKSNVVGKKLLANVAESSLPLHSLTKKEIDTPSEDSISLKNSRNLNGASFEYLKYILKCSGILDVDLMMSPSGGSLERANHYPFDASLMDVQANFVDFSASPLWLTPSRLNQSSFTVPIYNEKFYLYQVRRGEPLIMNFNVSVRNTLKPFDSYLWLVTLCCVICVGLLAVVLANARNDDTQWHLAFQTNKWKSSSKLSRARISGQVFTDAILHSSTTYFAGSTSIHMYSSISQKFITFGFAFFLLIITSSYTANLATFLSIKEVNHDWVVTMDEAAEEKRKICIPNGIEYKIRDESKWKMSQLVHVNTTQSTNYLPIVLDHMDKGKCSLFIASDFNLNEIDVDHKARKKFCDMNIVSSGEELFFIPWVYSVSIEYRTDFTKAIIEMYGNGITFEQSLMRYSTSMECDKNDIYLTQTHESNGQLNIMMMILPFTWLSCCFVLATYFKILPKMYGCRGFKKEMRLEEALQNEEREIGSDSRNHVWDTSIDKEDQTEDGFELYEYMYRVNLLSLELSKISLEMERKIGRQKKNTL